MLHSTKYHPTFVLTIGKRMKSLLKYLGLTFILIGAFCHLNAQSAKDSLFTEIAKMDSVLFTAFNNRDVEVFKSLFTEDLEFFHDKGGLTNYNHTVNFMKEVSKGNNQLRRELIKESLEVYPVPGYGAIQIGIHKFCHSENGKQDCGNFKFVHIWQKKNGQWKISRVVSYDH